MDCIFKFLILAAVGYIIGNLMQLAFIGDIFDGV